MVAGSSPLARGLLQRARQTRRPWRIIPARAGFTRAREVIARLARDHPRSRGVYVSARPVEEVAGGSSPLARGLHIDDLDL